jgi:hypothetical protein
MIWCRIDKSLKKRLALEARRRGQRGLGAAESDVVRAALVEYFEGRDGAPNGNGRAVAA